MKQFLIFSLTFISLNIFSQSKISLEGKYISKKRYSDVWTLTLNSDSTYIFDSKMGESILPGEWSIKDKTLTLSYTYNGKTYNYEFTLLIKKEEFKLRGKTRPFKGMKLKNLP